MKTRSVLTTAVVTALFVVCGSVAQGGLADAHCGANFDRVQIGGGDVDAFVLHRWIRNDDTRAQGDIDIIDIVVDVPVPNKLPGFDTLSNALDASFIVTFNHGGSRANIYAKCYVYPSRALGLSGKLSYAMRIEDEDGKITHHGGVCDIDPWTAGVQPGVPDMLLGDVLTTYTPYDGNMVLVSTGVVEAY